MSTVANTAEVDYWQGLEYDYSNADAYKIKFNTNDIEFGLIGVTTQLYSYGNGRYTVIPKNVGLSVNKLFSTENINLALGISYWTDKSMIFTDKLNYELKLDYNIKNNIKLQFEHYGLTSITKSNAGLNKVSVNMTF
jgi:hypothetical protein